VVDPARGIAPMLAINDVLFVDVKVKRVVWIGGVVRVAAQGFTPGNDLAGVFNKRLAFGQVLQRKNTFSMHAGAARLQPAFVARRL